MPARLTVFNRLNNITNMIMLSLLETAKANGADAYRYFEFIFREAELAYDPETVGELMPWSAKFRDFVTQNVHLDEKIPENEEKPQGKIRRKHRVCIAASIAAFQKI